MSVVETNGLTFHVQQLGQGPPVVMIHGMFLGNLAGWYFSVAPLLAMRHQVLMYDLRGHGRTSKADSGYDLKSQAADLHGVSASLEPPFDLVGHSYGGLIAMRYAIEHPERVRRLVVIEAPWPPGQIEENRPFVELDPDLLLKLMEPAKLRGAIAETGRDPDELLDRLLPKGMKDGLLTSRRRMRSLFGRLHHLLTETSIGEDVKHEAPFTAEDLGRVTHPTLCIYGEHSSCRPGGDLLQADLPNSRLAVLPFGHYLLQEEPQRLSQTIGEFLAESPVGV